MHFNYFYNTKPHTYHNNDFKVQKIIVKINIDPFLGSITRIIRNDIKVIDISIFNIIQYCFEGSKSFI